MTRRGLLFIGLFTLLAAVVMLPMRLGLALAGAGGAGLSARAASGLIWSGYLADARLGDVHFGTVYAGLRPWPLFIGQTRFMFERAAEDPLGPFKATLISAPGWRGLDDANGTVTLAAGASLPVERITLAQVRVTMGANGCERASGRVQVMLRGSFAGLALRNGLSGDLRCEGAQLLAILNGESGMERLELRLAQDRGYQARLVIAAPDPALAEALARYGFAPAQGGFVRQWRGRF